VQEENDRLRARRFQLELERGDRLQRSMDLEAENHALEEDAETHEIERLTLLQNIAKMQEHVQEAEVQVAALQAIVALQPLPPSFSGQLGCRRQGLGGCRSYRVVFEMLE
jgi:hypothetical protein